MISPEVLGVAWKGYKYWPYDDNNNFSQLVIIVFDSNGVEKKRISKPGYRYVSKIEIDNDNETIKFTTQSNSFTLDWSELIVE